MLENIQGIGVDLVDLNRFDLENRHFIERVLSTKELMVYDSFSTDKTKRDFLGGRFAAKEAVLKALGTGLGGMKFSDIEVLNDEKGKPYLNIPHSLISISHEKDQAIAFVIISK